MTRAPENQISFSIVIPLYNKEHAIASTLESVFQQTFQAFEVIVINDGSTDRSADIVLTVRDERLRYFFQENKGVAAARNAGIEKAKNPYIAFLDADDTWSPDYLDTMARLITDFPGATLYGLGNDVIIGTKIIKRNYYLPDGYRGYIDDYFTHAVRSELFWTSAVTIPVDAVKHTQGFAEHLVQGEDVDLWIRLAMEGPVVFDVSVKAHYRLVASNSLFLSMPAFHQQFIGNTARYQSIEQKTPSFRRYINLYRWSKLDRMYTIPGITMAEERTYLQLINPDVLPFYARIFLRLPRFLQKWILRMRTTYGNR